MNTYNIGFGNQELEALADELREEIVYNVSKTGGHLSSSLGVAELTVALHHVFNTPDDKIVWDVGHQVSNNQIPILVIILIFLIITFH